MKKFLFLTVFSSLLLGCATGNYPYKEVYKIVDFRPYTFSGFTLSPTSDGYKYTPIGTIYIEFYPGDVPKLAVKMPSKDTSQKNTTNIDALYQEISSNSLINHNKSDYFNPDADYCLAKIVEYAKSLGATGILDLKIVKHYTYGAYGAYGTKTLSYIEATGFAVVIEK